MIEREGTSDSLALHDLEAHGIGERELLIAELLQTGLTRRQYDVHPAGDRFVVKLATPGTTAQLPNELTLVLNWFEELRERLGN
jgi:hypothetical protein